MNALLLSRYGRLGASSRVRSCQYIPYLEQHGISVSVCSFFDDTYLKRKYSGERVQWSSIVHSYIRRCKDLLKSTSFDALWLEYEVFPWMPYQFESVLMSARVPYVVDYDDAIFHRYDSHTSLAVRVILGNKIRSIMRNARVVIAANRYIASYAKDSGAHHVVQIPTAVDLDTYLPSRHGNTAPLTIGWIGTPVTVHYLKSILPALQQICDGKRARLILIGSGSVNLPDVQFTVSDWSEEQEVRLLQQIDIGIMPLPNQIWERGKSGYKLIQYMACGKPVIASPVGINSEIVLHGENGFLATTNEQWVSAMDALLSDAALRLRFGQYGRSSVERHYSLQACAPLMLEALLMTGRKT